MMLETKKIKEIYDYLSAESVPLTYAQGAFIFCRWDPLVAEKASEIYHKGLVNYLMFTGGIGKDSGFLKKLELPEAKFQAALANIIKRVPEKDIYIEPKATNGGECCRFGIDTIIENSLFHEKLIVIAHPTSLRRVVATLEKIAEEKKFKSTYQKIGTNYLFRPHSKLDQKEAIAELLRLADWPAKDWCIPQADLPEGLVQYAREVQDEL